MKNGKMKLNKTKIVARVMLVVLLLSSALNLAGCTQNEDFDNAKRFNLNDGEIKFLCMSGSSYETRREVWDDGYCRGIYIVDSDETYERPYITYNSTIVDEDLGDGRTFYEKYIKKYLSFNGSYEYSMEIYASFYAFQDEVEIIRYEFDSYYPKGEKIKIKCEMTERPTKDNGFLEGTYFIGKVKEKNGVSRVKGVIVTAPIYHVLLLMLFAFFVYRCISIGGISFEPIVLVLFDIVLFYGEFKKQSLIKRYIFRSLKIVFKHKKESEKR